MFLRHFHEKRLLGCISRNLILTVVVPEIWNNLEMVEKNVRTFLKFQWVFRAIFDLSNKIALLILRRMYALYVKKKKRQKLKLCLKNDIFGSVQLNSAWLSLAQLGSAWLSSARLLSLARLSSAQLGSAQLASAWLGSA